MDNFSRDGFDFLPGALIEIDLSSRLVIYMNQIAFSLFEHTQADLETGLPLRDIFFSESEYERSIRVAESFGLENYQNRTAYTRFEKQDLYDFMMRRKDGSQFYAECQGSFVLDDDLVPTGARIYIRDLSEQRILEAKHLENEEKYRTLVENSSDIIFLIDNLGTVISVNQAATKYLGRAINEIEGRNIKDLFPTQTAETFMGYLNKSLLSGKRMTYETPMPTSNQSIWVSTSINPVRDRAGNITALLGVSRDITERKRSDEQLERALIEARNANKVKDQFLANISHEIRTPLTTITGFAERLKQSLGNNLKPAEEDYFKFINNSSTRLLKTLDAIINISELEAGTLQLVPKLNHLGQLVGLVCETLQLEASGKGLGLIYSSVTEDDEAWYDQQSIYQVLNNLIQNAIKYTDEGKVTVKLDRVENQLTLTISDTGIGISEEYRQRMFQVFSQESEGLTKEYQGIGLGLALTKRYLDLNNVKIKVESKKGQGSIFSLDFPERSGAIIS